MQHIDRLKFKNPIRIQVERKGKIIHDFEIFNDVTDEGINHMLGATFDGVTQIANWYIGLVDNVGFSAFADADVMNSHAGWAEADEYDEVTRPEWAPAAPATRSISNTTTVDFTMNATITLKGVFITSNSTKNGTTGTLWATAAFGSTLDLVAADVLKVTYTVSA